MMIRYQRQWWAQTMMAGSIVLFVACRLSLGASDTDELDGLDAAHRGRYFAGDAAPDDFTTWKKGAILKVTSGDGVPDAPEDQFMIELIAKNGATAIFKGRSTGHGCLYTVNGVYVGGSGDQPVTWTNQFEEETTPRIKLEINDGGTGDDVILPCDNGAKLYVWVLNITDTVQVDLSVTPDTNGEASR